MEEINKQIIELEQKEGVASIFGVLIYTDLHPNIKKVLRDDDYWLSFDEITGERFTVFSVKPQKQGRYSVPRSRSAPPGVCQHMSVIWKEPKDNQKLIEAFEIESTENLPMLLIFVKTNNELLKIEIKLEDKSLDSAYLSIKNSLEFCVKALSLVKEENLKNPEGLYASISLQNDHRIRFEKVKNLVNVYAFVKSLLP